MTRASFEQQIKCLMALKEYIDYMPHLLATLDWKITDGRAVSNSKMALPLETEEEIRKRYAVVKAQLEELCNKMKRIDWVYYDDLEKKFRKGLY